MDYSRACWLKHLFFCLINHLSHMLLFLITGTYPTNSKPLASPAEWTQSRCKFLQTFGRELSIKDPSVWILFSLTIQHRLSFREWGMTSFPQAFTWLRVENVLLSDSQGTNFLRITLFNVSPFSAPIFNLNFPEKGKVYEQQNNRYWIFKDNFSDFPSRIHRLHLFNATLHYWVKCWMYWYKFRRACWLHTWIPAVCALQLRWLGLVRKQLGTHRAQLLCGLHRGKQGLRKVRQGGFYLDGNTDSKIKTIKSILSSSFSKDE